MNGRNEVESYMYIEWLEAREVIHANKARKKQSGTEREYKRASTFRLSSETSSSDFLQEEKRKFFEQEEDKE